MNALQIIEYALKKQNIIKVIMLPGLFLMIVGVYLLVYYTGGIKFVYSHSMYIPIVLAGFIFGIRGGVAVAIIAGITLGPFMPIDTLTGEMQKTVNWIYRMGFFTLIGLLAGIASDTVKTYLKNLHWQTRHDKETSLLNRKALIEDLPSLINKNRPPNINLLLVASVNNTRQLKMAYGYEVIDKVVEQIHGRFSQRLYELTHFNYVYRADAGSIGALITDIPHRKTHTLLKQLANTAKLPFVFNGIPIHVDFRMGFIPFETLSSEPNVFLEQAESAMNHAHECKRDFICFTDELNHSSKENMVILGELVNALEKGQLSLHYQPKIDVSSSAVCGVEALMRWSHPERGNIPPGVFIPCAEHSTLIYLLTYFAIEEAIKQLALWEKQNILIPIAVNISPLNITQEGFAEKVLNLLEKYGQDAHNLELEMTEGAFMLDIGLCTKELNILAEAGVVISVDDFGTGYSSLQYLHILPISKIKIDQSFVRNLPDDKSSIHIVEASVGLAHKLNMSVVAEGVETKEVYDYLKLNKCNFIQGYYISRPLAISDFDGWHANFKVSSNHLREAHG
ncbi:MAG: bifunctional diguanylate cyclase/phosphodiesterase [Methylophaga sp.]